MTAEERRQAALRNYILTRPAQGSTGPKPIGNLPMVSVRPQPQFQGPQQPPPKQSFFNKVRDVFDANTQADQYRRMQQNQQAIWKDPGNLFSRAVVDNILVPGKNATVNTLYKTPASFVQGFQKAYSTGQTGSFTDKLARVNRYQEQAAKRMGMTGDINRDIVAPALETGFNAISMGLAGVGGKQMLNQAARLGFRKAARNQAGNVGRIAATNFGQGASQELYEENPTWKGAGQKAAINAAVGTGADIVLGGAAFGVGKTAKVIRNKSQIQRFVKESDIGKNVENLFKNYNDLPDDKLADAAIKISDAKDETTVRKVLDELESVRKQAPPELPPVEPVPELSTIDIPPPIVSPQVPARSVNIPVGGTISFKQATSNLKKAGFTDQEAEQLLQGFSRADDAAIPADEVTKRVDLYEQSRNGGKSLQQTVAEATPGPAPVRGNEAVEQAIETAGPITAPDAANQAAVRADQAATAAPTPPPASVAEVPGATSPQGVDNAARYSIDTPSVEGIPPTIVRKIVAGESLDSNERAVIASLPSEGRVPEVLKPGTQTRGFAANIQNNLPDNPTAQAVVDAIPGYKPIKNKNTLKRAADRIAEDPYSSYAKIVTSDQLKSADEIAEGNILLRQAIEAGDVEAAIQIGTKLNIDGTKLGQAVQAFATFKKTTPEGIVNYLTKQAAKHGNTLDPAVTAGFIERAKQIAAMPEGLERFKATQDLLEDAAKVNRGWKDTVQMALATPRAAMATADFSAPLRQGAVLGSRYPKQFAKNFKEMFKFFASTKAYEESMYAITRRPTYPAMKLHGLAVDGAQGITGTEEAFMRSLLETGVAKKLGFGKLVAASDRAYTGFLTKLRADVFDKIVTESQAAGVDLDKKALESLSKFINSASGRGSGTLLDKHAGLLSQALFSPKLWKSRIDVLNPVYYARLDPTARKLALQSAGSFASIATTVLGLASLGGADVELDPRSADFAKIKVGNTRYDVLGGLQQNIRLISQMVTGEKINSTTGEIQTLGADRGFGKPSRLDLLYQFIENKENPVLAFGTKLLRGTDPTGEPINPVTEAAKLAVPLNLQSTYQTVKDTGSIIKGVGMNIPGFFGIGVQTYGNNKTNTGTQGKTTLADQQKAALEGKKVTVDGKEIDYTSLKTDQKKELARTDKTVRALYEEEQRIKRTFSSPELRPEGLSEDSRRILDAHDRRDERQKQKVQDQSAKYMYDLKRAQYEEKSLKGTLTDEEKVAQEKNLLKFKLAADAGIKGTDIDEHFAAPKGKYELKLKEYEYRLNNDPEYTAVQAYKDLENIDKLATYSKYDKNTVDIYSMSEKRIQEFLENNKITEDEWNQLVALDEEYVNRGFAKNSKLDFGYGTGKRQYRSYRAPRSGSGGGRGGGRGGSGGGRGGAEDPTEKRTYAGELIEGGKISFKVPDVGNTRPRTRKLKLNIPKPTGKRSVLRLR